VLHGPLRAHASGGSTAAKHGVDFARPLKTGPRRTELPGDQHSLRRSVSEDDRV